jgi:STE24 endopeptidase
MLYWLVFATLVAVLSFPLTVYEGFFREHQYGLSNQSFTGWFRDAFLGFLIGVIFTAPLIALLYGLVRRFPASWHIWGTVFVTAFTIVSVAVAPVFIMPLFNQYKPLPDSQLKAQILSLAHANQIPVQNVYESDASRQSRRVSANVSGLGGTDRITLNDNLLQRCSPEGVLSVMGHEMGHYVMHHVWNGVLFSALLTLILFSFVRWSLQASIRRWGERWGILDSADISGLPLALLLLLTSVFVLTPVINTYTRTQEFEADIFGLNAARQPDGEAEVDLLLGEYRKLDPSPLEEFIFFDHPSGRRRIEAAMKWKAENLCLFDAALACENHALASGPR